MRKINTTKYNQRTIEYRDDKHYNHNDLCNDMKNINWKPIEEAPNVNTMQKYPKFLIDRHQKYRKTLKEDHVNS